MTSAQCQLWLFYGCVDVLLLYAQVCDDLLFKLIQVMHIHLVRQMALINLGYTHQDTLCLESLSLLSLEVPILNHMQFQLAALFMDILEPFQRSLSQVVEVLELGVVMVVVLLAVTLLISKVPIKLRVTLVLLLISLPWTTLTVSLLLGVRYPKLD